MKIGVLGLGARGQSLIKNAILPENLNKEFPRRNSLIDFLVV